jgi:hypothetical protein
MAVDNPARSVTPGPSRSPEPTATGATTFVSVVFEPELDLLHLQARSFARYADPDSVSAILVIDNTRSGIGTARLRRLRRDYGSFGDRLKVLRQADIGTMPQSTGWISQQVLKLLACQHVDTRFYVVLDAKNHLVRPVSSSDFENPDGRARGASHSYRTHVLRPQLERALSYLGVDPEAWLDEFPVTHTPVVLETAIVADMIDWIARQSGKDFATEFVDSGLLEFFAYSGWLIRTYGSVDSHLDGSVVRSANVWPGRSSGQDFQNAVEEAIRLDAPFFSAHRTALAKAGVAAVRITTEFWTDRGLFASRRQALLFVARFKLRYAAWMVPRKVHRLTSRRRGGSG